MLAALVEVEAVVKPVPTTDVPEPEVIPELERVVLDEAAMVTTEPLLSVLSVGVGEPVK